MAVVATSTIVAEVVDADGLASWHYVDAVERQATPPSSFEEWQPAEIPVDLDHDRRSIGRVVYLEHGLGHGYGVTAVAVVERSAPMLEGLQCSPSLRADAKHTTERVSYRIDRRRESHGTLTSTRTRLEALGLVSRTAGVTATRLLVFPGDLRDALDWQDIKSRRPPAILERARAAVPKVSLRSSRPEPLRIHRPGEGSELELRSLDRRELRHSAPYSGVLAVRSA